MNTGRGIDYGEWLRGGFLLGVAMFVVGAIGAVVAPRVYGELPGWEMTLFTDMIALGVVVAFLSLLFFGLILPLTE